MCAISHDVTIRYRLTPNIASAFCGGHGLVLNVISGTGVAFLNASGTVLSKYLRPNEELIAEQHCVLAFQDTVTFDVRQTGNCWFMCCSGQGVFNTVLRGPGLVLLQTMPLQRYAGKIYTGSGNSGGGGDSG